MKYSDIGLEFEPDTTFAKWRQEGNTVVGLAKTCHWYLGDWLLYGEDKFGEKAAQVIDADLGFSESHLSAVRWVCKKFPVARRVAGLSFQHHREVAGLDDQSQADALLKMARQMHWRSDQLREEVKAVRGEVSRSPEFVTARIYSDIYSNDEICEIVNDFARETGFTIKIIRR